jgi:hypothetical protein
MEDLVMETETARFTRSLPVTTEFSAALDGGARVLLPADWLVAATDVVQSRKAIAEGRYKAVNLAGAAMISAVMNALGSRDLPYAFGGDGSVIAFAPAEREIVEKALSALIVFVEEEIGLRLRAAIVPVSRIRADGLEVAVSAVRLSPHLNNYAFAGGGISHAEKLMKAGEFAVAKAEPGSRPDLAGLTCRWTPIRAKGKRIVSLILERGAKANDAEFIAAGRRFLGMLGMGQGCPMPAEGPEVGWPPAGLDLEAHASRGERTFAAMRRKLLFETLLVWLIFKTGLRVGAFQPGKYRKVTGLNTDYRKVQDGLRMTVSFDEAELARARAFLDELRDRGIVRYGMCVQDSAVLTCYVPSVTADDHFHFLDGAGGGYAEAASQLR